MILELVFLFKQTKVQNGCAEIVIKCFQYVRKFRKTRHISDNFKKFPKDFRPLTFDYGYCITCHKAQGSEYDKVLVFEEFLKGGDHDRWLYTAATRAKEKLVIVRNFR